MNQTQKYAVTDVFTPTSPARLTFVERAGIQGTLVDALRTPGKQIVVYGHSGSGKSTLLVNKLRQTYPEHVTTACMREMTYEQILIDAFDQLSPFYESVRARSSTSEVSAGLAGSYGDIKASLNATRSVGSHSQESRLLPPQLTAQRLAKFLGEAECCWVIEDFHKIEVKEKVKLAQTMKVFMDAAGTYRDVRVIAIGAVGTAREVVALDDEMRNRVSEIYVPLMEEHEILKILHRGFLLLNISVSPSLLRQIARLSNGLPAVAHQLALNLCFAAGIEETQDQKVTVKQSHLDQAVRRYLEEESDTIKQAFDRALRQKRGGKFDNCRLILAALARDDSPNGMSRAALMQAIRKKAPLYPEGNLSRYLSELTSPERGELVRLDANAGLYSFANPFHKVFARASLDQSGYKKLDDPFAALINRTTSTYWAEIVENALKNLNRYRSSE